MMETSELLKKITAMQSAAKSRLKQESSESMQLYVQGFADGLESVIQTLKKAIEAERTRQRLAKLESELAQDLEPVWPERPGDAPKTEATGVSPSRPLETVTSAASKRLGA
jgi:hypothetical protein